MPRRDCGAIRSCTPSSWRTGSSSPKAAIPASRRWAGCSDARASTSSRSSGTCCAATCRSSVRARFSPMRSRSTKPTVTCCCCSSRASPGCGRSADGARSDIGSASSCSSSTSSDGRSSVISESCCERFRPCSRSRERIDPTLPPFPSPLASMTTVVTFGTYDLFHVGHLNILRRAKDLGDRLVVGVSSDELNFRKKQLRPTYPLDHRIAIVESIRYVDEVFVEDALELKRQYLIERRADILVMGDDWEGRFDEFSDICRVVYLPRTVGISSTDVKVRIRGNGHLSPSAQVA